MPSHFSSIENSYVSDFRSIIFGGTCYDTPSGVFKKVIYDTGDIRYVNLDASEEYPCESRVTTTTAADWAEIDCPCCGSSSGSGGGVGTEVEVTNFPAVQTVSFEQTNTAPSNFTPSSALGLVFTLAAGEKGFIQNIGTNPLIVKYGTVPTFTSFNYILKGGSQNNFGDGASVTIDDYIGQVSVSAFATSGYHISWKF